MNAPSLKCLKKFTKVPFSLFLIGLITSCASWQRSERYEQKTDPSPASEKTRINPPPVTSEELIEEPKETPPVASTGSLEDVINAQSKRIETLEKRYQTLLEQNKSLQITIENLVETKQLSVAKVGTIAANQRGKKVSSLNTQRSPLTAFTEDEAVQKYREALIFFNTKQYSDSVLAFSEFLKEFSDHPLAGSAQFYVGESYFQQKEFKLAMKEFQVGLSTYYRSPHVPDLLKRTIETAIELKDKKMAKEHEQTLFSLFPQSPAAESLLQRLQSIQKEKG